MDIKKIKQIKIKKRVKNIAHDAFYLLRTTLKRVPHDTHYLLHTTLRRIRLRTWIALGVLFTIGPIAILGLIFKPSAKAEWYNEDWKYRKEIPVTNNTSTENNVYITITLDTSDTTKWQSDCDDLRITDKYGKLLKYHITAGCGTASTTVLVRFDTFPAGSQTIYAYYGNPQATSGDSGFGGAAGNPGFEQDINIVDQTVTTTNNTFSPTDNSLGLVNWTASKYTSPTAYFEAVAKLGGNPITAEGQGLGMSITCLTGTNCKLFYQTNIPGSLRFADCDDATCSTKTVTVIKGSGCTLSGCDTDGYNGYGWPTSIDCSAGEGDCKLVYTTNVDNGTAIYFVDCDNTACSTGTVTSISNGTYSHFTYPHIVCPSATNCKIAAYDVTTADVVFIDCDNATCSSRTITTLDNSTSTGSSLAISCPSSAYCNVAYVDSTDTSVKNITCNNSETCAVNSSQAVDGASPCMSGCDTTASIDEYQGGSVDIWCTSTSKCKIIYTRVPSPNIYMADCTADSTTGVNTCSSGSVALVTNTVGGNKELDCSQGSADCKISVGNIFIDCDSEACSSPNRTLTTIDNDPSCVLTGCSTVSAHNPSYSYLQKDISCPSTTDCKIVWDLFFADCASATCADTTGTITTFDAYSIGSASAMYCLTASDCRVAYYNFSDMTLHYLDCDNATCLTHTSTIVDGQGSANLTGRNTADAIGSLSTDSGVYPNMLSIYCVSASNCKISYYNETKSALYVADCTNATCTAGTIQLVDGFTGCPSGCSTSIDAGVTSVIDCVGGGTDCKIAYHARGGALKFADCNNAACSSVTYTTIEGTGCTPAGCTTGASNPGNNLAMYCVAADDCKIALTRNSTSLWVIDCNSASCNSANYNDLDGIAGCNLSGCSSSATITNVSIYCLSTSSCKLAYTNSNTSATDGLYFADCTSSSSGVCNSGTRQIVDGDASCPLTGCTASPNDPAGNGSAILISCPGATDCKISYVLQDANNIVSLKFADCDSATCNSGTITTLEGGANCALTNCQTNTSPYLGSSPTSISCVGGAADCKVLIFDAWNGSPSLEDCDSAKCDSGTNTPLCEGNTCVSVALYDSSGTAVSGATLSTVRFHLNSYTYISRRSDALALSDGNYTVRIKTPSSSGFTASLLSAKLVVVQTSTSRITDTQTQVEVGNNETSTQTSDTPLTDKKIYRYTSSAFSPTPTVYFEATIANASTATTTVTLYTNGATCSSAVAGSAVTVASATWTRVRSSAITLVNGTDYMVCIKTSNGTNAAKIANAKIILEQTSASGISAVELVHNIQNTLATDTDNTYTSQNYKYLYTPGNFSGGTYNFFFESTIKTSAGTGYNQAYNVTSGSALTNSEVTTTSTSYGRQRTASVLSMPSSASYIDSQIKNSAVSGNTTSVSNSSFIIQAYGIAVNSDFATPATNSTIGSIGPEEKGPGPIAYWKFEESQGTSAQDATMTGATGTLTGTTTPSWQTEDQCVSGKCLYFNGSTASVTVSSTVAGVQTVSMWVRPNSVSSSALIDLDGTARITVSSGTVSATGFTSPTLYINGKSCSTCTLETNKWQHVEVTTSAGISASAIKIGNYSSTYFQGFIDEVKLYNYARSSNQVLADFSNRGAPAGAGTIANPDLGYLNNGLLGMWKFDETSGNAADSSGNNVTLTNNNSTPYNEGKFGNAPTFNGSNRYFSASTTLSGVQTIVFWVKPASTTDNFINLASGVYINSSGGTISATGISPATIYVNGSQSTTITSGVWQHIVITTTSPITANTFEIGRANGLYCANNSQIDSVRLFNRILSDREVRDLFNFAPGPVGYWKLDDGTNATTLIDSSGNAANMTVYGNPSFVPGKFSSGFNPGINGYAQVSDTAPLSLTSSFTISTWIKPTANTPATQYPITGKWDSSNKSYLLVQYGDEIRLYVGSASNYVTTNAVNLQLGTWYHVEAVYNAPAQTVTIYVNGIPQAATVTGTIPSSISDSSNPFNIGTDEITTTNLTQMTITATTQDWEQDQGGFSNTGESNILFGGFNGSDNNWNGFRFAYSGNIPANATISSATLTLRSQGTWQWNAEDYLRLYVTDSSDAPAAATGTDRPSISTVSGGTTTVYPNSLSSGVRWPASGGLSWPMSGSNTVSVNFSSNIQYLVNKYGGLTSGNHIVIWYTEPEQNGANGSSEVAADDYSNSAANSARLDISYTTQGEYSGTIDDVKIYNYIRNQSQIIQDMNGDHPLGGSPIASQVAYFKFDEQNGQTINNSNTSVSLTAYRGTTSGSESQDFTWKTMENCKLNGCGDYDGIDDVTTVTNTTAIDINDNLANGFTFSTWINPDTVGEGSGGMVFSKGANTYCQLSGSSPFTLTCNLDYVTTDANVSVSSAIPAGSWSHVALTFNSSANTISIWINGKLRGTSNAGTGGLAADTSDLLIGNNSAGSASFDGRIDEFKIYSADLSQAQMAVDADFGGAVNYAAGTNEASLLSDGAGNPPVGYWNFDENTDNTCVGGVNDVCDKSGNGNDGSWNGTGNPHWTQGKIGTAGKFNGSDDYIQIPDNPILRPGNGSWTVSLWAKPADTDQAGVLISKDQATVPFEQWSMYICGDTSCANPGQKLAAFFIEDGGILRQVISTSDVADGNWHQYTMVADKNFNDIILYMDGKRLSVTSAGIGSSWPTVNNTDPLRIGVANSSSPNQPFTGPIDDVKVYNYARTQAQVAYDYNRGGPVGWWKFDECQGTTANDASGNGNNGTLTITGQSVGTCTTSSTAWGTGANGKFNSSIYFDGNGDFMTTSAFSPLATAGQTTTKVSWGGWFYPTASPTSITLMEKATEFRITTDASNNAVCGIYYSAAFHDATSVTAPLTQNAWNHVLCTYDGANILTYINGVLKNTTANTNNITAASSIFYVGENSSGAQRFTGQVDDVRIYNYNLSASQAKKLYNDNASARFGPATGTP